MLALSQTALLCKENILACITERRDILAARSSGLMPPGPCEKGVGAGVAGIPVLPPLDIPSST